MRKLMVIGASILQLPAIQKGKELGYEVAVIDYDPNAIGIPYADKFYNVSTIDKEGVYNASKAFGAEGIMTLATDMPMRSVAFACKKLGLTGISCETAIKATDKAEMIKAFQENDVAHPWFYIVDTPAELEKIKDKISYPCISKPTDNSGSRGIMLIHNEEELRNSVLYSSENGRNGSVIIEEYMIGNEVSVEVMTVKGKVSILAITDKITTGAPHFVEMGHTQPCALGEKNVSAIKVLAEKAVKAVGIQDGPAHVEIMVTKDGPKMVELGARMGGDCITTHLVPLSTGIDMVRATIETAMGDTPDIERKFNKGSAIRYFKTEQGKILSIDGIKEAESIEGVKQISFVKNVGDTVPPIDSSSNRIGFVIAQGETAEQAAEICMKAIALIKIKINAEEN